MNRKEWTIAAPLSRLRRTRRPVAVRAHGERYVVFLDERNQAHVLLDRCPHRGVQLSRGRLEKGRIACGYHGWEFSGDGACSKIPSLRSDQAIPGGISVPSFATVEQDGWVWFWPAAEEEPKSKPQSLPEFAENRWVQGTIEMACDWRKPLENNVDPTHAAFAHPWMHPQWYARKRRGLTDGAVEVRTTETGFILFVPPTKHPEDPLPAAPDVSTRFDLPDRVTVTFHRPFFQVIVIHSIPTGPGESRLETLVTNPLPFGPRLRWSGWEHPIFRQDRHLMESAETWTAQAGNEFERSVEADYSMLLVRKIIALSQSGSWAQKRDSLQVRRVLHFLS